MRDLLYAGSVFPPSPRCSGVIDGVGPFNWLKGIWKSQDRPRARWSEMPADLAIETLRRCLDDLELGSRTDVCFSFGGVHLVEACDRSLPRNYPIQSDAIHSCDK